MRDVQARLWAPAAAVVAIAAVRLVCSWTSAAAHNWWTMAGDALLLAGIAVLSAYYVTIILRRTREAGIAADRVSRLEMVTRELVDHEAMIRDDLVRGQRELNERIVRLSGILDASRDLVATRDFREVLERITDMARSVVGADWASLTADASLAGAVTGDDETVVITAGATEGASSLFQLSTPIVCLGQVTGQLTAHFSAVRPGASEVTHLLAIISSFAGVAMENARLYHDLSSANLRLEAARRYAEGLIEEVPVGIVVLDRDYHVMTWNRVLSETLRMPEEEVLGRRLADLVGMNEDGLVQILAEAAEDARSMSPRNAVLCDAGGGRHIMRLVVSQVESLVGGEEGLIVMAEDVTERVRLGEQLKQAERLRTLGEFAAGMVHEINNPIGIISACAEVLGRKLARHGDEFHEYAKTAKIIEDEAIRCSSIVRNLLSFAREAEMNPGEVNVAGLLRRTSEFIRGKASELGVELILDISDNIPAIIGDRDQLEQVFLNLAVNGIEAMEGGGRLHVSAARKANEVRVSFADTGPGIPTQDIPRVFNPFYTTKPSGTGLGLALSWSIIERHGGAIEVDNVSDDGGARFDVILPLQWHTGREQTTR
ncbi:MAG: two-component system sensor histidine kinase NtrB [Bacillota bacterium]|jgi:PAS domain S-box-containing protein